MHHRSSRAGILAFALFLFGLAQASAEAPGPYFAADHARMAGRGQSHFRTRKVWLSGAVTPSVVLASWYGRGRGEKLSRHSADGSIFWPSALTAASRTLPFGTRLRVSYRGHSTIVTITDRGPSIRTGRSLDLSRGAAAAIGMLGVGVARVSIEKLN